MIRPAAAILRLGLLSGCVGWGATGVAAPRIEAVEVRTSVRQMTITVNVRIVGATETGRVRLAGDIMDAAGATVLPLAVEGSLSATPVQVIQMATGWSAALPWGPGRPVLYRLALRMAGDGWAGSHDTRFGFREFAIDGRGFMMNGRPIPLRAIAPEPEGSVDAGFVSRAAASGFNAVVFTETTPGTAVLDAADEAGVMVVCPPDPRMAAARHPSVVMWLTGGTTGAPAALAHPERIGRIASGVRAGSREGVAPLKALDPTRPVASPDGAADAQVIRLDLERIPAQEREEWFSEWGRDGNRPVLAIVRPDLDPAVTRRMLRAWRLAGPVSVALLATPEAWPAPRPAVDGWIAGPEGDTASRDHLFHTGEIVRKTIVVANDGLEAAQFSMRWTVELAGRVLMGGGHGEAIPAGTIQSFQAEGALPGEVFGFPSGRVALTLTLGATRFDEAFPFRVFPRPVPSATGYEAAILDPEGATTAWLKALGWKLKPWTGQPGKILVIGRKALDKRPAPGSIAAFVAAGGRALIMAQSPQRFRKAGWAVASAVVRQLWPAPNFPDLPLLAAVDGEMLRDWRGFGTLVPDTTPAASDPAAWRWGNRGSVCSAPVVVPKESGWTPLIVGGPDRSCAALLELRHGKGLVVLCTLDIEGRVGAEPAVNHLATRLMDHLRTAPALPKPAPASAADRRLLDFSAAGQSPRQ